MVLNKFKFYLILFCALSFYEIYSEDQENFIGGVRFKSIKCEVNNKTILVKYCYLKAISRKVVTYNVGVKLLATYTKPFLIHTTFYYHYGTIFRQIIDTKKLDLYGILAGVDTNPIIKLLVEMIKNKAT